MATATVDTTEASLHFPLLSFVWSCLDVWRSQMPSVGKPPVPNWAKMDISSETHEECKACVQGRPSLDVCMHLYIQLSWCAPHNCLHNPMANMDYMVHI